MHLSVIYLFIQNIEFFEKKNLEAANCRVRKLDAR
jgi:hypothetical protein